MARNYFESLKNTHKRMADIKIDPVPLLYGSIMGHRYKQTKKNDEFYFWLS